MSCHYFSHLCVICRDLYKCISGCLGKDGRDVPSMRDSIAACIVPSKICLCLHTSTTLRSFCCTSLVAPLYAVAVASAMTGENAIRKSSFLRAFDCCATSATPFVISIDTSRQKSGV
jgi:hypothetical protein